MLNLCLKGVASVAAREDGDLVPGLQKPVYQVGPYELCSAYDQDTQIGYTSLLGL